MTLDPYFQGEKGPNWSMCHGNQPDCNHTHYPPQVVACAAKNGYSTCVFALLRVTGCPLYAGSDFVPGAVAPWKVSTRPTGAPALLPQRRVKLDHLLWGLGLCWQLPHCRQRTSGGPFANWKPWGKDRKTWWKSTINGGLQINYKWIFFIYDSARGSAILLGEWL